MHEFKLGESRVRHEPFKVEMNAIPLNIPTRVVTAITV